MDISELKMNCLHLASTIEGAYQPETPQPAVALVLETAKKLYAWATEVN